MKYKVTFTTPFDQTPQETTVQLSDKHKRTFEQAEKAIKDNFIRRTMLVSKVEEIKN